MSGETMIHIKTTKDYKSIKTGREFDLPIFTVITGKNGSGKSHLMEAMSYPENVTILDISGNVLQKVKYIGFNGLNPNVDTEGQYMNITNERKNAWYNVQNSLREFENVKRNNSNYQIEQFLRYHGDYHRNILLPWLKIAKGDYTLIDEELVNDYFEFQQQEMFSSQFAAIFKLYQIRLFDNEVAQFRREVKGANVSYLSKEEFEKKYGPKPWDLINNLLAEAQLTYRVNHPSEDDREADFHLSLHDVNTGVEIQVNDLSTGEKVLMSLALSIYNSKEEAARPDVLCLDEPDAPLHPEFSRVLIDSIVKHIVGQAGVRVIISTHSPTTVALAPEESLYMMDKTTGVPHKISKREGINILTRDIENMRLSIEDRRQIFVENKNDVCYYQKLYSYANLNTSVTPQFLPARPGDGCNCEDVKNMTNWLRSAGNDLVYGVIDYDGSNNGNQYIKVVGGGKRYSIENYIFDPIFVAILLIRENILNDTTAIGTSQNFTFTKLHGVNEADLQTLIDWVENSIGLKSGDEIHVKTLDGHNIHMNSSYLLNQGHDLESKIADKWKPLMKYKSQGETCLKNHVLDNVIKEYPEYISTDIADLFSSFT